MKTSFVIAVGLTIIAAPQLRAQTWKAPGRQKPAFLNQLTKKTAAFSTNRTFIKPQIKDLKVTERGANHRVWQYKTFQTNEAGEVTERTHSYTELANGLCWKDSRTGQWIDSDPEIVIAADGKGLAHNAPCSVRFQPNINTAGAIDLTTPSGNHLRSHVIAIYLHDWKADKSMQIAGLQDSVGTIVGKDQVVYEKALIGNGVVADVRYKFGCSGMGQDVIFRTQLPAPQLAGLNAETTQIEIWTEFLSPPQPEKTQQVDSPSKTTEDRILDFGDVQIGVGRAFQVNGQNHSRGIPVKKEWVTLGGRTFLIESVPYKAVQKQIEKLPARADVKTSSGIRLASAQKGRVPPPELYVASTGEKKLNVASVDNEKSGFVVDYETLTGSIGTYTFKSGETYYISGATSAGIAKFESGTVIKYASGASLSLSSPLCETDAYRPAVFTAKDDDSVGEAIYQSTGSPSGYYASCALNIGDGGTGTALHDVQIRYAQTGVAYNIADTWPDYDEVRNAQILHCGTGIDIYASLDYTYTCYLGNVLINDVSLGLSAYYVQYIAEHLTVDNCTTLIDDWGSDTATTLTARNSIFAQTSIPYYDESEGGSVASYGNNNGFYNVDNPFGLPQIIANANPFQTQGGGSHYLKTDSGFSGEGTTSIDSTLLNSFTAVPQG